jgi:hypothetical protein
MYIEKVIRKTVNETVVPNSTCLSIFKQNKKGKKKKKKNFAFNQNLWCLHVEKNCSLSMMLSGAMYSNF